MNDTQTTGDTQTRPESLAETPAKRIRVNSDRITQKEIDDANSRHERIIRSAAETVRQVIELGRILITFKKRVSHGKWIPFVERNLKFQMRAAQRYMQAAEEYNAMTDLDPAEFMAKIWGHKPKQLKDGEQEATDKNDAASHLDEDEDEDDDVTQHGGPGFEPGFFPDKGKPDFFVFKNFVALLEGHFFGSENVTTDAKLKFVTELISWLEHRKGKLTVRKEREQQLQSK
jgi:hypothetical protein